MCTELKKCGVSVLESPDGMTITGGSSVHGGNFESYNDHRIAMSMAVCALAADTPSTIVGEDAVSISYPTFFDDFEQLRR